MRVISVLLLLLGASAVSAEDDPATLQDLSQQQLVTLQTELQMWKLGDAGKVAKKHGFIPTASSSSGSSVPGVDKPQSEELRRLLRAKRKIKRLQKTQPHATFSINTPFALMTPEEFAAYTSGGVDQIPALSNATTTTLVATNRSLVEENEKRVLADLPASVDWQSYGCVTPVRDQGGCNTCVAFSTIAAVESSVCIRSGAAKTLVNLSEQDSISCGIYKGNCEVPQYIQMGFDWMPRLNGGSVCTAATFPLVTTVQTSSRCLRLEDEKVTCAKPDLNIVGYNGELLVPRNSAAMMQSLAQRPVVAEINSALLQYYSSGVLLGDEKNCPAGQIDHAVLLTGYGEQNGVQYWRFKNSWGVQWGEKGYVKIQRGYNGSDMGACGIERSYHYPVFASDAPTLSSRRSSAIKPNVQLKGTLLDSVSVIGTQDCSEKCRVKAECTAFTFDPYLSVCNRYASVTAESTRTYYQSGRILTRAQTDAQCLGPEWHFDFPGNDIQTAGATTYTECCDLCNKVDNCHAYTWTQYHGGSCYLKTKKSYSQWKGANNDGSAYFIPAEVYKCQPLIKNTDLTGTDIGNAPASRAESCCAECRLKDGCTGFTWTNYNGGTCWLKSGTYKQLSNNGAVSGFV